MPTTAPFKPSTTGEACMKRIIANDQSTHRLLVRCQAMQLLNSKAGRKLPALDAELARLTRSYNNRQKKVRESRLLKVQQGVTADVKALMNKLKSWFSISGHEVGALPLAVVIPVAVVTLSVAGYLLLKAFGPDEKKAVQDIKDAAHLDERYKSMTPEQQVFFDQTADAAGKAGYQKATEESFMKTALFLGGGLLLVKMLAGRPNS